VRDRSKSRQSLADAEQQLARFREQVEDFRKQISDLNVNIASCLERETALQAALARGAADSAAVNLAYEQEIGKLRAEISSHPCPDEKCTLFLVFIWIYLPID
jgi:hypothetical protein